MRLAWNLVIIGVRELDKDWTKILETSQPVPARYEGHFRAGATPAGNNTKSRQQGYVGKQYELPAIRQSPGNHGKIRFHSEQMLCTYCRYQRSALQQLHKIRKTRFGCQICGPEYPLCDDRFSHWHSN